MSNFSITSLDFNEGEEIPKVDLSYDNTIGEAYSEDNSDKKGEKMFSSVSVE